MINASKDVLAGGDIEDISTLRSAPESIRFGSKSGNEAFIAMPKQAVHVYCVDAIGRGFPENIDAPPIRNPQDLIRSGRDHICSAVVVGDRMTVRHHVQPFHGFHFEVTREVNQCTGLQESDVAARIGSKAHHSCRPFAHFGRQLDGLDITRGQIQLHQEDFPIAMVLMECAIAQAYEQ